MQSMLRQRGIKFRSERFWSAPAELPPEPSKVVLVRAGKRAKVKDDELQGKVADVLALNATDRSARTLDAILRGQELRFSTQRC